MRVSPWAVSRIRLAPAPDAVAGRPIWRREKMQGRGYCPMSLLPLSGPFGLPLTQSSRLSSPHPRFPSCLPSSLSWAKRAPPSSAPRRGLPQPWLRTGLPAQCPCWSQPQSSHVTWRLPGATRAWGEGWEWGAAPPWMWLRLREHRRLETQKELFPKLTVTLAKPPLCSCLAGTRWGWGLIPVQGFFPRSPEEAPWA